MFACNIFTSTSRTPGLISRTFGRNNQPCATSIRPGHLEHERCHAVWWRVATGQTIIPKDGTTTYNIWSATRNRQSGGCWRRCRPTLLRRQQNYFVMLWARCRRRRRRKLQQRHRSDCRDCALNMSVAVVT